MHTLLKDDKEKEKLHLALKSWFARHKRPLPWRNENHWYKTFLSEFLLQQTQVAQALPYYKKFIRAYPDIYRLASASEDELLELWAGLGYYSRARNLRKAAQDIVSRFGGNFPQNYADALSLPGIGPYTASAVLSMAFNLPLAVVDGNVLRVISRLFNITDDLRRPKAQKTIRTLAKQLLPHDFPGLFNEALMELGALICRRADPHCAQCPLQEWCLAKSRNNIGNVPFKSPARPKKRLFNFVLLLAHQKRLLLVKRPGNGLLASMWEFPLLPTNARQFKSEDFSFLDHHLPASDYHFVRTLPALQHTYSHIALRYKALCIVCKKTFPWQDAFYVEQRWLEPEAIASQAIHKAHQKILESEEFKKWWQGLSWGA